MCLAKVTKRLIPTDDEVTAYKLMCYRLSPKRQLQLEFAWEGNHGVVTGTWMKRSRSPKTLGEGNDSYERGFHTFATRTAAMEEKAGLFDVVIEVNVRRVRTIGRQFGEEVLVSDELFVPSNWKDVSK